MVNRIYIGAALILIVFLSGMQVQKWRYEHNENKQLKSDAKDVAKIEDKADVREAKTRIVVKTVTEELPEWSIRKLPAGVLHSLHDYGL